MNTPAQALAEDNIKLPVMCAYRLVRHVPPWRREALLPELVSSGNIGLVEAANRFDVNTSVKFRVYAWFRIEGRMRDYLRSMDLYMRDEKRTEDRKAVSTDALLGMTSTRWDFQETEKHAITEDLLSKLTPRFAAVVRMRYLEDADVDTIAKVFSVSRQRISAILSKSLEQLRSAVTK